MDSTLRLLARLVLAAAALPAAAFNHDTVVGPIAPGRFAVACSNVEQDTGAIAASGGLAVDFWEGREVGGRPRYITEILARPDAAIVFDAPVPDVRRLYPGNAGDRVTFAAIVCHPTSRANGDPNYPLPENSGTVPRMLPAGAAPRLISAAEYAATLGNELAPPPSGPARLPLVVYSHGLAGSPISKGYIDVMTQLAAQGYMVAAVFHGDPRFSRVRLEDFNDYWYAVTNFDRIVEMQLMRPVALKAMTDVLLASAYAPGVDAERIAGFGASMGGQAMAHLLGARITSSLDKRCDDAVTDPRIKAAVAYVPYAGQTWLPSFCDDQRGAEGVDRPYLAITGAADTTSPQRLMEQAMNRFRGARYLVSLAEGRHELRSEDAGDLFTWMVTFYNAYLDVAADPGAKARLIRMAQVSGGREDSLAIDVHVPTRFDASLHEGPAREFHHTGIDHYFLAAGQGEIDNIVAGGAGPGWELTHHAFKVFRQTSPEVVSLARPVCRFYGLPAGGPNSHFFTAESAECEVVKRMGNWLYEGIGFHVLPQRAAWSCGPGELKVMRAYNNRHMENDANHRFSTSDSTMREMQRRGWIVEGTAWCSRF